MEKFQFSRSFDLRKLCNMSVEVYVFMKALTMKKISYNLQSCAKIIEKNCEKRPSVASHKQFKTLLRANMVKLRIISLYIYKDLRLKT